MGYTPTTWVTGDYITTTKLNKMEQGIADSGGGGTPVISVTTLNGISSNRSVFAWYYAIKEGNTYTTAYNWNSEWISWATPGSVTNIFPAPIPMPSSENIRLLVTTLSGAGLIVTKSGGISNNPVLENGGIQYYEVTGDFSITFDLD